MARPPTKIGILLTDAPGLNARAFKYLVLHQNTLQDSFEFQFLPTPEDDEYLIRLQSNQPIDRDLVEEQADEFFIGYKKWLKADASDYGLTLDLPDGYVILSVATFLDDYFMTGDSDWLIIALGNWKRHMSPPSVAEFFLSNLVVAAIDIACGEELPIRHYTTRGCVFDFAAILDDARFSVLTGFVCDSCRSLIIGATSQQVLEDARLLLKKDWLGDVQNPTDVSNTTKKLGYDLFHTRGIKQTLWERLSSTIEQGAVENLFKIIGGVILAAILIWLGLKKN